MAQATITNETKDDEESWATVSDTPDLEPVGHGSEDHWLLERDDMLEIKDTFAATAAKGAFQESPRPRPRSARRPRRSRTPRPARRTTAKKLSLIHI